MNKYYMIAHKGSEIDFTDEEFSTVESNKFLDIWSIFHKKGQEIFRNECKDFEFKSNALKEDGICHINNVLNSEDIASLKQEWAANFRPIRMLKDSKFVVVIEDDKFYENEYSVKNHMYEETSHDAIRNILGKIMNESTTKILNEYFESHFSISYIVFSEAFPDSDPITSFRWHKDYGPGCQTHMMVYLDDAAETGGRTEFVNYSDSKRIDETGYNTNDLENRIQNISKILESANVISPQPAAGDGLIFNATRIYHCGIHPKSKSRKVIILVMQPDLVPWTDSANKILCLKFPMGRNISQENPFHPYYVEVEV